MGERKYKIMPRGRIMDISRCGRKSSTKTLFIPYLLLPPDSMILPSINRRCRTKESRSCNDYDEPKRGFRQFTESAFAPKRESCHFNSITSPPPIDTFADESFVKPSLHLLIQLSVLDWANAIWCQVRTNLYFELQVFQENLMYR